VVAGPSLCLLPFEHSQALKDRPETVGLGCFPSFPLESGFGRLARVLVYRDAVKSRDLFRAVPNADQGYTFYQQMRKTAGAYNVRWIAD
jgi:hypothetical protein